MSAILHNVVKTPQVGDEVFVDMGSDKATGKHSYVDSRFGWDGRVPRAGSSHPAYPGLYLKSLRGVILEGEQIRVDCDYESFSATYPGRAERIKRYDLELTTSEEPLLTHPKLKAISDDEKSYLNELMGGVDKKRAKEIILKVQSGPGKEAVRLILAGTVSYVCPGMSWVERYTSESVSGLATGLGKKASPPGNPPSKGDRDWIYMGGPARMSEDGKSFDIERRWVLSGAGGADTFLYT